MLDRSVLAAVSAVPSEILADRGVQDPLLLRRFPQLAAIPSDPWLLPLRFTASGVIQTLGWQARARSPVDFRSTVEERRLRRIPDRRRFKRIYDINGPGWLAVRRLTASNRDVAQEFLVPEALTAVLPAKTRISLRRLPERSGSRRLLPAAESAVTASGLKSLTGFILWCREYLS